MNRYIFFIFTGYFKIFQLLARGFNNLDALEPSEEMLDLAKQKSIYTQHICDVISASQQTSIFPGKCSTTFLF